MLGFWKQIPNPFDLVLMPIALVCYAIFMARNGMIGRQELCLSFHCSLHIYALTYHCSVR